MFKNYLKVAFRNIQRNKAITFINLSGFAVGITACILITFWIVDEFKYDKFHKKSGRIYRIVLSWESKQPRTPHPMALAMVNDFAEVENAVSLSPIWGPGLTRPIFSVRYEDKLFDEREIFSADTTFFDVFTFPFIAGDPKTALKTPFGVIITKKIAKRYFGNEEAIGKTLRINDEIDLAVTGVLENIPTHSHFSFDFLVSYITLKPLDDSQYYTWNDFGHYNYIVLNNAADPKSVETKISGWIGRYLDLTEKDQIALKQGTIGFQLQPLTKIHLFSNIRWELQTNGNIMYIYIFSAIALLIIVIASINFMNLATACSINRALEVGVRKTAGATRNQVRIQFIGESFLLCLFAMFVALLFIELILPAFNNFTGKNLEINIFKDWVFALILAGCTFFLGIFSGSYPAFFMSSFSLVKLLQKKIGSEAAPVNIRKVLVVFQFAISVFLIISTLVIYDQINYLKNKTLGFNKDQVVVIPLKDQRIREKFEAIREILLENPDILLVTGSSNIPGKQFNRNPVGWRTNEDSELFAEIWIDYDFFDLLEIKMAQGRSFAREMETDSMYNFIINETASRLFDWENPINEEITYFGDIGTHMGDIIGVTNDFHYHSLHQPITPLIIMLGNYNRYNNLLVKIHNKNIERTLNFLQKTFEELDPEHTYEYSFLDTTFKESYEGEERMGTIFWIFALLGIIIASLGLLGLEMFMVKQRTKEVGIRKVHGATTSSIVTLLLKEFLKWILIANLVAWPFAYFVMNNWLQNFAFQTNIKVWGFFAAALIALSIAIITVGFQALKAGRITPVDTLRYE